jgi:hypothetical protein
MRGWPAPLRRRSPFSCPQHEYDRTSTTVLPSGLLLSWTRDAPRHVAGRVAPRQPRPRQPPARRREVRRSLLTRSRGERAHSIPPIDRRAANCRTLSYLTRFPLAARLARRSSAADAGPREPAQWRCSGTCARCQKDWPRRGALPSPPRLRGPRRALDQWSDQGCGCTRVRNVSASFFNCPSGNCAS